MRNLRTRRRSAAGSDGSAANAPRDATTTTLLRARDNATLSRLVEKKFAEELDVLRATRLYEVTQCGDHPFGNP